MGRSSMLVSWEAMHAPSVCPKAPDPPSGITPTVLSPGLAGAATEQEAGPDLHEGRFFEPVFDEMTTTTPSTTDPSAPIDPAGGGITDPPAARPASAVPGEPDYTG
jgi:hypothetical protein